MNGLPSLRNDLVVTARKDGCSLVTDPVSGAYFLFSEAELSLAKTLSESGSIKDWVERWNFQNRSQCLRSETAERFLDRLVRDQLVGVAVPGYGLRLHSHESKQNKMSALIKNPLAIRIPGFNPAGILNVLTPVLGWLFRPVVMVAVTSILMLVFGAVFFTTEQLPGLPSLNWLATPQGMVAFACVFVGVKVLHELGHAIAAHVHHARCRQIGVLFLFFMPTLYCDVSDAWRLESRWRRIAISAAGIYVELILALLASIGWTLTGPGPLNGILFQVMVLCSVSTVLINGNPLLRYDGYYVISDLLNQPNLNSTAAKEFEKLIGGILSWRTIASTNWGLVLFRICSFAYRMFVIVSIAVTAVCVSSEYSLGWLGWAIAGSLAALFGRAFFGRRTTTGSKSRYGARLVTAGVVAAGVWFAVCVPQPRWVYLRFQVHPLNSQTIYATVDGKLENDLFAGCSVVEGESILTIKSPELEFETGVAEVELRRLENEVTQLERRCRIQPELNELLGVAREQKNAAADRLIHCRRQLADLSIASSVDGRVQSLLETSNPRNRPNLQVLQGQPIAQVIDDNHKQLRLLIHEADVDLLNSGQEVYYLPDSSRDAPERGVVGELLLGQWAQPLHNDEPANPEEASKTFVAAVETSSPLDDVEVFSGGTARVRIASATFAKQFSDLLQRTFQYR